jgi:hypothetical protein
VFGKVHEAVRLIPGGFAVPLQEPAARLHWGPGHSGANSFLHGNPSGRSASRMQRTGSSIPHDPYGKWTRLEHSRNEVMNDRSIVLESKFQQSLSGSSARLIGVCKDKIERIA